MLLCTDPRVMPGRWLTNGFIALSLGAMLLTGLPSACSLHEFLREPVAQGLGSLGLAQPRWRLFAPNVLKVNSYVEAEVVLADGSRRRWNSPDWRDRTLLDKFAQGQFPKFYDNLRRDKHRDAWRPFAEWVVRQVARGENVREVRLERRFAEISPPDSAAEHAGAPSRERYPGYFVFYRRRFR